MGKTLPQIKEEKKIHVIPCKKEEMAEIASSDISVALSSNLGYKEALFKADVLRWANIVSFKFG